MFIKKGSGKLRTDSLCATQPCATQPCTSNEATQASCRKGAHRAFSTDRNPVVLLQCLQKGNQISLFARIADTLCRHFSFGSSVSRQRFHSFFGITQP